MKFNVIVNDEAELDTLDVFNWYENESVGLGNDFINEVEKSILSLEENPYKYQLVFKNVRRLVMHRFPYGIFFIIENEKVFILSISHLNRHPKNWKQRIRK